MLNNNTVKKAEASDKPYKLYDGGGLYLLVSPTGSKGWRFKYRFGGREKLLSFGRYPDVSLARAREKRKEARDQLDRRIDPSVQRRKDREAERVEQFAEAHTFEYVALEYLLLQAGRPPPMTKGHKPAPLTQLKARVDERFAELAAENRAGAARVSTLMKMRRGLERYVFPYLGRRPVGDHKPTDQSEAITAQDVLSVIRRVEARGTNETAHRTLAAVRRVLRYAVASGYAKHDVSTFDARLVLAQRKNGNFAAITDPKRFGELLRAIDGYSGEPVTRAALKLAPLVFVRPGELRAAEWSEFDFDAVIHVGKQTRPAPEWRIPGERMKMGREHIVPLSRQAVAILEELRPLTGSGRFLFPSVRDRDRYLSDNTLTSALRRLGYAQGEVTAHGFRATASTLLHELGFPPEVIELQLAHQERNAVKRAYNRSHRIDERRTMMQTWADYLDALRAGQTNVTALKRRAR